MGNELPSDIVERIVKIAVEVGVGADQVLLLMIMTGLNVWDAFDDKTQPIVSRPKGETLQ